MYIDEFPWGLEDRRSPFEGGLGFLPEAPQWFLFLTGRGTVSPLFMARPLDELMEVAQRTISMGYTQLWVLEWRGVVDLSPKAKVGAADRRAVQQLCSEQVVVGHSHCLLGERKGFLGHADTLDKARQAARVFSREHHTPVTIGLLRADVAWH